MTQEPPSRLDRIEAILEQVATNQESLQQTVRENTTAIATLTNQQAELRTELQESISHLVGVIGNFAEEAHNDREQAKTDRQAWQAEIQRIWEYLLKQSGNGRNP